MRLLRKYSLILLQGIAFYAAYFGLFIYEHATEIPSEFIYYNF